jgi:Mg/Co/Ni transporter MgtE
LPSENSTSSTCGFTLCQRKFFSAETWISLSKWPMLQTIARSFIARMWSMVMTSTLPVAVTKMSALGAISSIVLTS